MKNLILVLVFIILHSSFLIHNCLCQWEPDVKLTTGTGQSLLSSYGIVRSIATEGPAIHIVWYDNRDGNTEIYYKQSTNNGINWTGGARLTNNSATSEDPSIAVSGLNVTIIWNDDRDGNLEIYCKRSSDGGISWGADTRLTNNSSYSAYPSVAVSGSNINIVWQDNRDGNYEVYYKWSTNNGLNWGSDTRLTTQSGNSQHPSVSISGSAVHVTWTDDRDGNSEIYYKYSTNNGLNWTTDTRLTNNSAGSRNSSIAASGSNIHLVWEDSRDGNWEIYYKRSLDNGTNWGADTRLTTQSEYSVYPSIAISNSVVHLVWVDNRDLNYEIYYKQSTNNGINWTGGTRLTNNSAVSEYPSLTLSGSIVHIVWQDNRDGNYSVYYKRNPTGNSIGIKNINSEIPEEFALGQNYPNPFNAVTNIKFKVACVGQFSGGHPENSGRTVTINVFDMLGREVATIVNEYLHAGTYEIRFDAENLPSGMYFYQLKSENFTDTKKLILLK